ncbi:MAG: 16S rRNA (guanine(527)-N(7))-methyltransferase RsmG [Rubrobacteraceae bacterium]
MNAVETLSRQVKRWDLTMPEPALEGLILYAELMSGYKEANVIGAHDVQAVLLDHVLDSMSCLLHKPLLHANNLADIGSGAGLPALPVKLMLPSLNVAMVESNGKKVRFLEYVAEALDVRGVDIVPKRAEEVGHEPDYRGRYDIVTSRAVASLSVLAEYCLPLTRVGGYVIAMKGDPASLELEEGEKAAEELGAKMAEIIDVPLLSEMRARNRTLVILEKVRATPSKYPRRPGMPKKQPLGKT